MCEYEFNVSERNVYVRYNRYEVETNIVLKFQLKCFGTVHLSCFCMLIISHFHFYFLVM